MDHHTWDELVTYEPDLLVLEAATRDLRGDSWTIEFTFTHQIKRRMKELVGYGRPRGDNSETERLLRSPHAYQVANTYLYDLRPKGTDAA